MGPFADFHSRDKGRASPQGEQLPGGDIRMTIAEPEEPEQDIRSTLASHFYDHGDMALTAPPARVPEEEDSPGAPTRRFRPRYRPPMAVINIVDDNQVSGENVRIRGARCVIGREQGDITFPDDVRMSARHAEIIRCCEDDEFSWYLNDLQSTNGSFVNVASVHLKAGDELILGSRTFLFLGDERSRGAPARLVELTPAGQGQELVLDRDEVWVGRDSTCCPEVFQRDPLLGEKDARLCLANGRWGLKAVKSVNGVWFRVARVKLANRCWFQLGEQRFRMFFP